jgi:hypothetical protein
MKTTIAVDSAIFFFCFESKRDDIRPGDVQRLLRHLSGTPNIAIYVPITVIGETVVEYLTEETSKREINELHELIDFWGALHLNFLYPTDLVADACYKLVETYKRGSHKDYRLSDTDLVHLGYALAYKMDYFLTTDKSLGHYVPNRSKLNVIDLSGAKALFKN